MNEIAAQKKVEQLTDFKSITYTFKIYTKNNQLRHTKKIQINPRLKEDYSTAFRYVKIIYDRRKYNIELHSIDYNNNVSKQK
jgi:hypothetical protein